MSRSTFFGFDIATRGLYTAQRGLTNVNHNIDNINTPGYSRQKITQTASRPLLMADGTGMLGTGADVTGVFRVRDMYLDTKYRSEAQYLGEWDIKDRLLEQMQAMYNEPSDSGFNAVLNDFTITCSSWQQILQAFQFVPPLKRKRLWLRNISTVLQSTLNTSRMM